MRTIEAEEARALFQDVPRAFESGETVADTVRGVLVAHPVPVQERYDDAAEAIEDWKRCRKEHHLILGRRYHHTKTAPT